MKHEDAINHLTMVMRVHQGNLAVARLNRDMESVASLGKRIVDLTQSIKTLQRDGKELGETE